MWDGNVEVLKSPIGSDEFCTTYCDTKIKKHTDVCLFLSELEDAHVAHYLLTHSVNNGRLTYMARTTPLRHCENALQMFDRAVIEAAGVSVKQHWSDAQSEQATFAPKDGGLGFRKAAAIADAAYVASRSATQALCAGIRDQHCTDLEDLLDPVGQASERLVQHGVTMPESAASKPIRQQQLSQKLYTKAINSWDEHVTPDDRVRRKAHSAKGAGKLYSVTPSKTLDTKFASTQFAINVACRLGVDVMEGGHACPKCGIMMDCKGIHPQSCMSGGGTRQPSTMASETYSLTTVPVPASIPRTKPPDCFETPTDGAPASDLPMSWCCRI